MKGDLFSGSTLMSRDSNLEQHIIMTKSNCNIFPYTEFEEQLLDIFTKALSVICFQLCNKLGMFDIYASI